MGVRMKSEVVRKKMGNRIRSLREAITEISYAEYAGKILWRPRVRTLIVRVTQAVENPQFNEKREILRDAVGNSITTRSRRIELRMRKIAYEVIERMVARGWIEIDRRGRISVTPLGISHRLDRC